jgi:hypothetical protein
MVMHLTKELLFSPDEPLFPKTKIENNTNRKFEATGLLREHWQTASPIREIFKRAFQNAREPRVEQSDEVQVAFEVMYKNMMDKNQPKL